MRADLSTHQGVDGVESITGVVVVIDVFRASNTIIALLDAGAREVFLLADLERARALKNENPRRPLIGERGGVAPDDFDGGNSPSKVPALIAPGDAPILTTSAGTQAVARLTSAETVLFASFANASAVAARIRTLGTPAVTMLPMGLEGRTPAVEDDEAARWITGLLEGRDQDFESVRGKLLDCDGARRLKRLGQEDDLSACTELDTRSLVPVVRPGDPPRAVVMGAEAG
jgi:2-phosphosulfolactate phosphatase